ncbi:MAG: hypothetical protein V7K33_04970 [Nostoc sp.]
MLNMSIIHADIERFSSTTKPSAAECDLNTNTWFVIAEPKYGDCCRLVELFEGFRTYAKL